ncbi:MAG TPA: hypothetical protein V6D19_23780, partial [Stenomitos sp.]
MPPWFPRFKPPAVVAGIHPAWIWMRQNLFNSGFNTCLTLVCLGGIGFGLQNILHWVFTQAQWQVVTANLRLILVGRYPVEQIWRLWLALGLCLGVVAASWNVIHPWPRRAFTLMGGIGGGLALAALPTGWSSSLWLVAIAAVGMGAIQLGCWVRRQAFGRTLRSWLPLVWFCTVWVLLWL